MIGKLEQNQPSNKKILASFLYLFVMDLVRVPFHTFKKYNQFEPGFALPMLKAYIAAFQMKSDGKISHELIKTIHKTAMTHLNGDENGKSDYRMDWGTFGVFLYKSGERNVPTYSATRDGVYQFVSQWIANPKTATHFIAVNNQKVESLVVYAVTSENELTLFSSIIADKKTKVPFREEKHLPILLDAMEKDGLACEVTTLENVEKHLLPSTTQKMMQTIIDDYEHEVTAAKNNDSKIRVICKYVQRINQLHPFMDGNIRTCYVLLNKLLNDFNLPLSLLINPNRLDCCSIDEIVSMVKEGQAIYESLLVHQDPNQFVIHTKDEIIPQLKSFSCPGVSLDNQKIYEDFVQFVLNTKTSGVRDSAQLQCPVVIHSNSNPYAFVLHDKIEELTTDQVLLKTIKDGAYGLALRRACAFNAPCLVKIIIQFKEELELDINQQSTNGNTALDWFDLKTVDSIEKSEVRTLLVNFGAVNNTVFKNPALMTSPKAESSALTC
ncbi:MAG: Fic family protein [Legionellales bacterium]